MYSITLQIKKNLLGIIKDFGIKIYSSLTNIEIKHFSITGN